MIHELKTRSLFFESVRRGLKTFEIRFNDRNFQVGDILWLREWDHLARKYTGAAVRKVVLYVCDNPEFVRDGFVTMSLGE